MKTEIIHGIIIKSRYDAENEISEMRKFIELLNEEEPILCNLIKSLYYDSKASFCMFEFNSPQPDYGSAEMKNILYFARLRLSQFEWNGWMEHGEVEEPEEQE